MSNLVLIFFIIEQLIPYVCNMHALSICSSMVRMNINYYLSSTHCELLLKTLDLLSMIFCLKLHNMLFRSLFYSILWCMIQPRSTSLMLIVGNIRRS